MGQSLNWSVFMGYGFVKTALAFGLGLGLATQVNAARQMENLSRGLVAANVNSGMLVSWRLLGTEKPTTAFNLYRDGTKIATVDGKGATNFLDASGKTTSKYTVAPVVDGVEGQSQGLSFVYDKTYKFGNTYFPYANLSVDVPKDLTMPDGTTCSYTPNDMSVGDLDGDGELELVLKWDPSNSKDNANSGYTGNVYIDAYKIGGAKMWRIDLGKNIRAGAHYTQFMVYDLDGDGMAEIAMKTSDGTVDGKGVVIGDASKDYRTSTGTIMSGNEFLTVFAGATGAALKTVNFWPARGKISGDTYGNRDNRMLAAIAYLDGEHPSLVTVRGYYTESFIAAYDWDGKDLKTRWQYSATTAGKGLYGQGNHNLSVGDIDADGYDEIVFGAGALNHDGTLKYRTGLGHGDAMHLSDLDPDKPGLEVWDVHEETSAAYSDEMHDKDGNIVWGTKQTGGDNGRGLAADLDSTNRGFEMWSYASGAIHSAKGVKLWDALPSQNFRIYFDGDLQDELLDATGGGGSGGKIEKWNQSTKAIDRYFSFYNVNGSTLNNYTKANPCIVADLLGDWREEFIVRSGTDASIVTIFSTPVKTDHRLYTLLHDSHYRVSVAWQNVAYNQPPHVGYYLPDMVKNLKQPDIYTVSASGEVVMPSATITKNGAGSSRQTVVLGSAIVDFAYAYTNCTGVKVEGLPKGVTATLNTTDKKIYISGTPTEVGTFAFTATTVGGTGDAASLSGQIVVTDPSAPESSSSVYVPEESSGSEGGAPTVSTNYPSEVNAAEPDDKQGVYEEYNAGWLDNGYFNSDNAVGSYGTWELYSKNAGEVTVVIRFANGGVDPRNMTMSVNGEDVREVEFGSTEGWTSWMELEVKVNFVEGKNVIKLTSTSALGGPNIDLFYFDQADICLYRDYESGKVVFTSGSSSSTGDVASSGSVNGVNSSAAGGTATANSSSDNSSGSGVSGSSDSAGSSTDNGNATDNGPGSSSSIVSENDGNTTAVKIAKVQGINSYNVRTGVIRTAEPGFAEVYYFDMLGNMRVGHSAHVPAGESVFKVREELLPKGTYMVRAKLNGRMISSGKYSKF